MQKKIVIKNAKLHNLKGVSVEVPYNAITVITGVSGSGKSSLAFDTLYAEGQRRFVESLSAYARQFLERMAKPEVEKISGILPAVAIDQKSPTKNQRSTVGTATEIYDYLRLLYGRIGITYCHKCGKPVHADNPASVVAEIMGAAPTNVDDEPAGEKKSPDKCYILYPVSESKKFVDSILEARMAGYFRLYDFEKDEIIDFEELSETEISKIGKKSVEKLFVLTDRLSLREENRSRLTESVEMAFHYGGGHIAIWNVTEQKMHKYSEHFECADCGITYLPPDPRLFSFNNPAGACPECQGFGQAIGVDENLVIPDKTKTLSSCPIVPWKTPAFKQYFQKMIYACNKHGVSLSTPYMNLSDDEKKFVWDGGDDFIGINGFFKFLEKHNHKIGNRMLLARYRGYTSCPSCGGARLRLSGRQVKVGGKSIPEIVQYPINRLLEFASSLKLTKLEAAISGEVLREMIRRITLLRDIGLEYLTLDRLMHTLSGGEAQRINLSSAIGSALTSTLYVLDEPSIGLHPRDTEKLIAVLNRLKKLGNTVVVVEHDPEIMEAADRIIDMGPRAGVHGGEVCFAGTYKGLLKSNTLTADYLTGRKNIKIDYEQVLGKRKLTITKPRMNNLRLDSVEIPLNSLVVVSGVSGSGKSTLIQDVLYTRLYKAINVLSFSGDEYEGISGFDTLDNVEIVDQTPLGRTSRSTPITYTKAFDAIRDLFASTQAAKQLGYKSGYFSFNIPGGRCDVCDGEGTVNVDMQFLPDVRLVCEACHGTRYKREARSILYRGKSIVDVLDMTIDEAIEFFQNEKTVCNKLIPLQTIGLGYLKLGQSGSTLSGGEAQRVKLSSYIDVTQNGRTLFIFDEPTTGLHLDDINKLVHALRKLVECGHSVVVIEHNLHVIACADWVIDLGPEGGFGGGLVVAEGTPYAISECPDSYTGMALRKFFGEA